MGNAKTCGNTPPKPSEGKHLKIWGSMKVDFGILGSPEKIHPLFTLALGFTMLVKMSFTVGKEVTFLTFAALSPIPVLSDVQVWKVTDLKQVSTKTRKLFFFLIRWCLHPNWDLQQMFRFPLSGAVEGLIVHDEWKAKVHPQRRASWDWGRGRRQD